MKKTLAQSLRDKFQKLVKLNAERDLVNDEWLNAVMAMLEKHRLLDTWEQIKDAWQSEFDPALDGNLADQMIKANKHYSISKMCSK